MTLVIGNKNYSSWSLRPWLAMKQTGIPLVEQRIALYQPDSRRRVLEHSPSGKVPVLKDGATTVWDSLAILEYLAEVFPDRGLWPQNAAARASARSMSAEMHSGFTALRARMPMNLRNSYPGRGLTPEVEADIARIVRLWTECRATASGPFLFGHFCIADAMFAPVATRFVTYGVKLPPACQRYVETLIALPALQLWYADARAEREALEEYDRMYS
ncbi:MAG TPA: glutathione S-transferase family protein [Burkholderiales bacterium]